MTETLKTMPTPYTHATGRPEAGAMLPSWILVCVQLPCRNSHVARSMSTWLAARQAFLPSADRRLTRLSTPRWPCSRMATTAPRNVR